MTMNRVFDVVISIVTLATITSLILPGRQTSQVITAGGTQFRGVLRQAMGQ